MPKLVDDSFLQNRPGLRAFSFADDALIEGVRDKTIWAEIDPNNTFVTRVVVEWGDALPTQLAEVTYTMQDELQPMRTNSRFTGDVATYSTQPDKWGVKLALRGDGPDVVTPGFYTHTTGNANLDAFLTALTIIAYIPPSTTPAQSLRNGSRVEYALHVFYKQSPAPGAQEFGIYLPVRRHTYGPAIQISNPPLVVRPVALQFQGLQQVLDAGLSGVIDAGDEFAVDLRAERAVTRSVTLNFYSDPEGSLQVVDANGQVVTSTTFVPGMSDAQNPFLQHWKVRVIGPADTLVGADGVAVPLARQLWVHASGYRFGQIILH